MDFLFAIAIDILLFETKKHDFVQQNGKSDLQNRIENI